MRTLISVVVPCFNESAVMPELHQRLSAALKTLTGADFEIVYVDDGSSDNTTRQIQQLSETDFCVKGLMLSRNFGQEAAITAGLTEAAGNAVVIMDADLQDPPELIAEMFARWREGWQVVVGERLNRAGETTFKRWAAALFYRLLRGLDASISHGTGNFRLLDRAVVDALLQMPEQNRFVRGMISWTGFRQISVPYRRAARFAGKTKYPLRKMLHLATDAVTSFSLVPLRLATVVGVGILLIALLEETLALLMTQLRHPPAVNRTLLVVLFLGGAQLLSIGIMGEYVGRIYAEVRRRPLFVVRERCGSATVKESAGGVSA